MGSFSYVMSIILHMGVVLYTPCLALHTITAIPVVALILLGGSVATIYTVMVIISFKSNKKSVNDFVPHAMIFYNDLLTILLI